VELDGAGRPNVAGFGISVGWERELTGGAHASARGEREDIEDGRQESKKKRILLNTPKARAGYVG
jgi:hypothetical protein